MHAHAYLTCKHLFVMFSSEKNNHTGSYMCIYLKKYGISHKTNLLPLVEKIHWSMQREITWIKTLRFSPSCIQKYFSFSNLWYPSILNKILCNLINYWNVLRYIKMLSASICNNRMITKKFWFGVCRMQIFVIRGDKKSFMTIFHSCGNR